METWMIIVAAGAALIAAMLATVLVLRSKRLRRNERTSRLREGFGPEYDRTVSQQGRGAAEKDLLERQERATVMPMRTLTAIEAASYRERWSATQGQFVDDPGAALTAADRLVTEVMVALGYPSGDFEHSTNALSVDHPRAAQDYRAAHELAQRNQRNAAPTDDLRAAMSQFHAVITELIDSTSDRKPAQGAA